VLSKERRMDMEKTQNLANLFPAIFL
jgi:hypothetical protein